MQTGNDEHPSLLTFDKLAIYNSADPDEGKEEPAEGERTDAASDEMFPEHTETDAATEDKPAEEKTEEQNPAETVDGKDAE